MFKTVLYLEQIQNDLCYTISFDSLPNLFLCMWHLKIGVNVSTGPIPKTGLPVVKGQPEVKFQLHSFAQRQEPAFKSYISSFKLLNVLCVPPLTAVFYLYSRYFSMKGLIARQNHSDVQLFFILFYEKAPLNWFLIFSQNFSQIVCLLSFMDNII